MFGTSNGLRAFRETFSQSDAKHVEASVALGIDRFVARHFSIGLDAGASYADDRGYGVDTLQEAKSTSLAGGVRLGYDVPLGERFSWYPRLTFGISSTHSETTVLASRNGFPAPSVSSSIGPTVNLYAPLLLHLVPHFFVGFGPRLWHRFGVQRGGPYDGTQTTLVGADLVVGGWWGEGGAQVDSAPTPAAAGDARFGRRGQLVLGLATDASLLHVADSASKYSETAADLSTGADYFVVDNVSIGIDAFISHSSGKLLDPNDIPTDFASTSIGMGPRVGNNVNIGNFGSFWPQVELGYGTFSTRLSSSEGTNQHSRKRFWLRFSTPVLVNVTSHFLLGLGPYFFDEISNKDQNGIDNDAESVGVRLLMVGWFDVGGMK